MKKINVKILFYHLKLSAYQFHNRNSLSNHTTSAMSRLFIHLLNVKSSGFTGIRLCTILIPEFIINFLSNGFLCRKISMFSNDSKTNLVLIPSANILAVSYIVFFSLKKETRWSNTFKNTLYQKSNLKTFKIICLLSTLSTMTCKISWLIKIFLSKTFIIASTTWNISRMTIELNFKIEVGYRCSVNKMLGYM